MTRRLGLLCLLLVLGMMVACQGRSNANPPAEPAAAEEAAAPTPTAAPELPTPTPAPAQAQVQTQPQPQAQVQVQSEPAALKARAQSNLNLRTGPGTNYPVIASLPAGQQMSIFGRNANSSWLLGQSTDGRQLWVTADPGLVNIDRSQVETLAVVETPPSAYDTGNPKVDEFLNKIPLVIHHGDSFTCASPGGFNKLSGLSDGNVIGPHSGDFVLVSQNKNVLFKYTGGSLQLVRESAGDSFPGGETTIPLERALQMVGDGEVTWTGRFGEWPARGVTNCDPAAKP